MTRVVNPFTLNSKALASAKRMILQVREDTDQAKTGTVFAIEDALLE